MQTLNIQKPYGYIYKITCKLNNKRYYGQTTNNPAHRWNDYKKLRCKSQIKIYNALKKYGIENFSFEIVAVSYNMQNLDILENAYIILSDSIKNGYNCKPGGRNRGKQTNDIKRKISEKLKGHKQSKETIEKRKQSNKNQKMSEETKQKISNSLKGRKRDLKIVQKILKTKKENGFAFSDESKKKMSEAQKGSKNYMYGKKHKPETILKMKEAARNRNRH